MIDAATGQPAPCPMCGSHDVRWRRRRWYDNVRNTLRHWLEIGVSAVFRPTNYAAQHMDWRGRDGGVTIIMPPTDESLSPEAVRELQDGVAGELHDGRVSAAVPASFWKCRSCGRDGHEFDEVAGLLPRNRPL